ncbi:hypothetical protein ACOSOMT5_P0383 [Acidiphilium sp. MT5]
MRKYLLATVASLGMLAAASGVAHAQAAKAPAPGTIVVHLNGLLNDQINDIGSSINTVNGYKLNPIGMSGFLRLYPGFDGTTEGGLQYGVASELRTAFTNAGQGIHEGGGGVESLVIRRAYAYVGTKEAGYVRFGQTDGTWDLLTTGEYYNYGDGNEFNSDGGVGAATPGNAEPKGLFSVSGALYTTNKIVYLSPDIAGFQVGFDFEPNSNGFKEGETCGLPGVDCATLASAPGGAGNARRKNTLGAAAEYTGKAGAIGYKVSAAYLMASPIGSSGPLSTTTITQTGVNSAGLITGKSTTTVTNPQYKGLRVDQFSAQVTYGGFLLGANFKSGQVNNGYTFLLPGQRDALFYEVTGVYTMGPATIGAQYFNNQSAGDYTLGSMIGRTETDYGFDVGANYALSPHFGVYATYLYGHRHQYGADLAGTAGKTSPIVVGNNVQSQAISAGAQLKW